MTAPTWIDHTYSCRYVYADGTFVLSVKELDDRAQTLQYFAALGTQLGRLPDSTALGPDSFLTSNGSLVLRKDTKVLLVDVSHLPAQFGQPPAPPSQVSQAIGGAVLSCWTGAAERHATASSSPALAARPPTALALLPSFCKVEPHP